MVSLNDSAEPFNITLFCKQVTDTVLPMANKHGVKLVLNFEEELEVTSQQGLLAQVLIQLVQNSLNHAFNDDIVKIITIGISKKQNTVELIFEDNGKGIDNSLHKKVFDPLFTTTRNDGATGLGLSLVSNIVHHKLGGRIVLTDSQEQGCKFIISIPNLK